MKLVIKKNADSSPSYRFCVDTPERPGAVPVGYGRTMKEALGDWLINNQRDLNLFIDVDETAKPTEMARRRRELSKR